MSILTDVCYRCKKPLPFLSYERGMCDSCWEREEVLTDEAIARAAARIKELGGGSRGRKRD